MTSQVHLYAALDHFNAIAGYTANSSDAYTLDGAYGGWRLCQYCNGGLRSISPRGTRTETLTFIHTYADGFVAAAKQIEKTNRRNQGAK
tara:strand:- start:5 stop:271 length:267 start_codon:yes stop_codon:yes gene_type:complete